MSGIGLGFNRPFPAGVAEHIEANGQFVEVIKAPEFEPGGEYLDFCVQGG